MYLDIFRSFFRVSFFVFGIFADFSQAKHKSLNPFFLFLFSFLFVRRHPKVLPAWDWEFHCHKVVLCTSPWWRALMRGGFREGGRDTVDLSGLLQEGITRPEALEAVVR